MLQKVLVVSIIDIEFTCNLLLLDLSFGGIRVCKIIPFQFRCFTIHVMHSCEQLNKNYTQCLCQFGNYEAKYASLAESCL